MGKCRYKSDVNNKKIFHCAAYIRLSQDDGDKEESNSVTNQREVINYYLKNKTDIELYDYYIDDGFTGTDFKRPSFQRMLDDIINGNIDTVIVKDLSRFGRNYIEVGEFIEQVFPQYNVRFISISDNIDNVKNPESLNNMIVPFKNIINEEYSRDISKKVRSVKKVGAKQGKFMQGLAPYGYIKDPNNKYKFLIDIVAAKVVKLIYKLFLSGKGYSFIAKYLNDKDIPCPSRYKIEVQKIKYGNSNCNASNIKDKKWSIKTVKTILQNQVYCGDMIQGKEECISHKNHKSIRTKKEKWIIAKNTHEAIISREDFEKVQKMIEEKQYSGAIKSQPNLYAGHLRCAKCGKPMIRKYTGHRESNPEIMNYNYYCSTYAQVSKNDCILNKVRSEDLDKIVLKAIKKQIKLYLNADKLLEKILNNKNDNSINEKIEKVKREIDAKRKIKLKFYEDWKLKIITKEDYIEYTNEIESTINKLNDLYIKYSEKLSAEEKINDSKEIFENIKKYQEIKKLDKNIIDDLINNIYSNEDGTIEIEFKYKDEYKKLVELSKKIKNT